MESHLIGWWALLPVAAVVAWLFANTKVFRPVPPGSWAADGIYGEQRWLEQREVMPRRHRSVLRWLIACGTVGAALMIYGLVVLHPWPTVFGAVLFLLGQIWRIDRMGMVYAGAPRGETADTAPPCSGSSSSPGTSPRSDIV